MDRFSANNTFGSRPPPGTPLVSPKRVAATAARRDGRPERAAENQWPGPSGRQERAAEDQWPGPDSRQERAAEDRWSGRTPWRREPP
ncbi:hypothetical protein GCM10010247_09000 [Streptomyces calvus]|nr:hypothetical protein GCM10010247_09000 [Streptomyces calvus]